MDDESSILPATVPPSRVQQATTSFITAVDSGARKEGAALAASYAAVESKLKIELDKLEASVGYGPDAKRSWPTDNDIFRRDRYKELIRLTNVMVGEYAAFAEGRMTAGQIAAIGAAYNAAAAITVAGGANPAVATGWAGINQTTMLNLQGQLAEGAPAHDVIKSLAPDAVDGMRQAVIEGAAMGLGPAQIVRNMRQVAAYPRVRAERLVRTEILRAANEGLRKGFIDLGIKQWRWSAALSRRTCPACLSMNGKIFPITTPMPRHVQCRCSMSPVVPGVPAPGWEDGEEWLKGQPSAVQNGILGRTAGEAWRQGVFPLSDLVGLSHDPVWGSVLSRKSNRKLYEGFDDNQKHYWDVIVVPRVRAATARKLRLAASQRAAARLAAQPVRLAPPPVVKAAPPVVKAAPPAPQPAPAAIPWTPTMTRAQADLWAAGSDPLVAGRDFYHGTSRDAGRAIRSSGFDLSIITNGRVYGNGVYMGGNRNIAESYSRGDVLTLRVKSSKVADFDAFFENPQFRQTVNKLQSSYAGLNHEYTLKYDAAKTKEEKKKIYDQWQNDPRVLDPRGAAIQEVMTQKGYDAWYSKDSDYWIIPDATRVVVISDA
jgi:SPP1 gp7 family putative phage head morphogenesis protein